MTEVSFETTTEKSIFLLKASRMYDGGYRDFVKVDAVIKKLQEQCSEFQRMWKNEHDPYALGAFEAFHEAVKIVVDEVG